MDARSELMNCSHRGRIALTPPRVAGASIWRAHVYATGASLEATSAEQLLADVQGNLKGAPHAEKFPQD